MRLRARAPWLAVIGSAAWLVLGLAACGAAAAQGLTPLPVGPHDALTPAGPQAEHIGRLWNVFLAICTAVFIAVLATFAWAVWRGRRAEASTPPDLSSIGAHEQGPYRSVVVGVAVSTTLLIVLLVASVLTDRALARLSDSDAMHLQVTGHQWWWEHPLRRHAGVVVVRHGQRDPRAGRACRSSSRSSPTT